MGNMTIERLIDNVLHWVTTNGVRLVIAFIVLSVGWKIINKSTEKVIGILEKKDVDATLRSFLNSFISLVLKVLLVIMLMEYVDVDTASFAALIASAGLAVGLALQGSLSNFAGGFIILLLRPFRVGDFIETGSYTGTVEHIKIFYTTLLTPDNKEVLLPNGPLANSSLINYSSKGVRRVDIDFGISYTAPIDKVKTALYEVINSHELILQDPEPFVGITSLEDSSVTFTVRAWTEASNYWPVYLDLMEAVKRKLDEENIEIPYNKMDVTIKNN